MRAVAVVFVCLCVLQLSLQAPVESPSNPSSGERSVLGMAMGSGPPPPPVPSSVMLTSEMMDGVNTTAHNLAPPKLDDIVVVIPTMRRYTRDKQPAPEHYLKPLVQGIAASMTPAQSQHVSFLLMNVDPSPQDHTELQEVVASVANVTVLTKSHEEHLDMSQFIPRNEHGLFTDAAGREISADTLNWRAGETMDAPKLWLRAASMAPYVMFLEDDVTPTSNVITKVYAFLEDMKKAGKSDFLMVDLYTPAISWGPQTAANMEIYDYECCTQAMLFNSNRLGELAMYEFDHPENPVDDNIRDFVRQDKDARRVYAMVPNPFEHVGAYSTNSEKSFGVVEHKSLSFLP